MKTAVIAGATGLVGAELLNQALESTRYDQVIALTRRPLVKDHPKFTNLVVDFNDLKNALQQLRPDDVFCSLGTTMAKAGSKEKFFEVDYIYAVSLAKATVALGATQYMLVSALGANKKSSIFYNRVKGQVEEAVKAEAFSAVHIFRPSVLAGHRGEKRSGEEAAKKLYKIFGFLISGKYKPIEGETVARAMIAMAARDARGHFLHASEEMQQFAARP